MTVCQISLINQEKSNLLVECPAVSRSYRGRVNWPAITKARRKMNGVTAPCPRSLVNRLHWQKQDRSRSQEPSTFSANRRKQPPITNRQKQAIEGKQLPDRQ